jgi:hypothetical protein
MVGSTWFIFVTELLYLIPDIDLSGVGVRVPEEFAVADLAEGFD